MGGDVLFHMWHGYRESLIRGHEFYVAQAKSRLLTQFGNISAEADQAEKEWIEERRKKYFDPDRDDPADIYEGAQEVGIEFYQLLSEMEERTRLGVIAGFFHEWEKNLRQWLVEEIRRWPRTASTQEAVRNVKLDHLFELLVSLGWDIKSKAWFPDLDACRLVVNVHKHGEGPSLRDLYKLYPAYLVNPHAQMGLNPVSFVGSAMLRPSAEHLHVTDAQFDKLSEAIASFWKEIPEMVEEGVTAKWPGWFKKALDKDRGGAAR